MTFAAALFWIIAGLTGASAVMVVVTQNIVRAAVWLLFTLVGTCGVYFLLGADFVGATQLIVYVGGTLVLVVFGVMLTAQGPFVSMKSGAGEWAISLVVGILLYGLIGGTVFLAPWNLKDATADKPLVHLFDASGAGAPVKKTSFNPGPSQGLPPRELASY